MNKCKKQIISTLLVLCVCIIPYRSVFASEKTPPLYVSANYSTEEIMPLYNNVGSVTSAMNISSSGRMTISYKYTGFSSTTTKAVITTYIEKRTLGLFWTKVDIGEPNNQWVDTINDYRYNGSRTYQLSSSGTYRVTIVYKIYGTGGTVDTIAAEHKDSY